MKTKSEHSRFAIIIISCLFLMLSTSCGGGGGGGDGGGGDGGGGQILSEYAFALNLSDAQQFTLVGHLEESEPAILFIGAGGNDFNGTLELNEENGETSLASVVVDDTTFFGIDVTSLWGDGAILAIDVTESIVFENGDDPDSGSFTIGNEGEDSIIVSFYKTMSNEFMVDLQQGSGGVVTYRMDVFKDLLGSEKDPWQQQASVAYHMIEMLFDQVNLVASMLMMIEDDANDFSGAGVVTQGDDPLGGTLTLSCVGGNVQPGANFSAVFDELWKDDPDDDIDTSINGSVDLMDFWRTDANGETTVLGFGSIIFGNAGLNYNETGEDLIPKPTHTVYGSYSLIFSKP